MRLTQAVNVSAVNVSAVNVIGGVLIVVGAMVAPAPIAAPVPVGGQECAGGPGWELATDRFDPGYARHAFVGNGYLSQRVPPAGMGYASTGETTGFPLATPRYDAALVAGLYSEAESMQTPQKRHAFAAIPTWSTLNVGTGSATYTSQTPSQEISNYRQTLNLRCGSLRTELTWTASDGKATDLVYEVVADRAHPNVGAVRVKLTPHWTGQAQVTDVIDGAGARRMRPVGGSVEGRTMRVDFETDGVAATGSVSSTLRAEAEPARHAINGLTAEQSVDIPVREGQTYEVSKYVGVDTSVTTPAPAQTAQRFSRDAAENGWDDLFAEHARRWLRLWDSDIRVPDRPDVQNWLRSTQYALLSSVREGQNYSVPPAGLSSDNYAGLIFWDTELWMFPALLLQHPELARSVVDYRYKTLEPARANAQAIGQQGAFYPWTSADTGDLQKDCHSWDPPHCLTQIHLQGDVAFAAWQYFQATGDRRWLHDEGWPVIRSLAEFWAGRVTRNSDGSYSINNVAGPDEYSNGVNDGVFTNAGAATTFRNAAKAAAVLGEQVPPQWAEIADKLRMPFDASKGVFLQYDGYQGGTIKQADTVLLQYPLEWPMTADVAAKTLDFYAPRTDPDGPAMTDAVHAIDAAATGEPGCAPNTYLNRSIRPFVREPFAQFAEARGDRAGQGAGAPALNFLTGGGGFTQVFTNGLTGLRLRDNGIAFDPLLPPQLPRADLIGLHWQGRTFDIHLGPQTSTLALRQGEPFTVQGPDGAHVVSEDAPLIQKTRRPDLAPTSNLARCHGATATSEEAGKYAEAAVDGSSATTWALGGGSGSITVDLGSVEPVAHIAAHWTDVAPSSYRFLTSVDGQTFSEAPPDVPGGRLARYVRVELTGPEGPQHAGLRELEVTR